MANALLYNPMKQNEDPRVKLDEEVYEQFIPDPANEPDNTNWGIVCPRPTAMILVENFMFVNPDLNNHGNWCKLWKDSTQINKAMFSYGVQVL